MLFEQCLADTLRDSAVRLAMDDHRVDRTADIVNHSVADDLYQAGIGIDFDLADMRAVRKTGDRQCLVADAGEWALHVIRQILTRNRQIDQALDHEDNLGPACTAIRCGGNDIGDDAPPADISGGDVIYAR
jgi:hypothetical protein